MRKFILFFLLIICSVIYILYAVPIKSDFVKSFIFGRLEKNWKIKAGAADFICYPLRKLEVEMLTLTKENYFTCKAKKGEFSYQPLSVFSGKITGSVHLSGVDFSSASLEQLLSPSEAAPSAPAFSEEFFRNVSLDFEWRFAEQKLVLKNISAVGEQLKVKGDWLVKLIGDAYQGNITLSFSSEISSKIAATLGESVFYKPVFNEGPAGWVSLRLKVKKENNHFNLEVFPFLNKMTGGENGASQ